MKPSSKSTRRSFIRTAGTAISGPVAAAAATRPAEAVAAGDEAARLARFEDLNAIRALSQAHAAAQNARAFDFGRQDVIEIAPDRLTATATVHCVVEHEIAIGPACPTVDMTREQGGGVIRHDEPGVFDITYIRRDGAWVIERSTFRPA